MLNAEFVVLLHSSLPPTSNLRAPTLFSILCLPLLAAALAAVPCGVVGSYCVSRHNTYAAGALSHACFAGLGLARYLQVAHGCAWATPTLGALAAMKRSSMRTGVGRAMQQAGAAMDGALYELWHTMR